MARIMRHMMARIMRQTPPDAAPRQRLLSAALVVLLIAFAFWCVVLLYRTLELRSDLDLHLGWLEDVRTLRGQLELQRAGQIEAAAGDPTSGTPAGTPDRRDTPARRPGRRTAAESLATSGKALQAMVDRLGDPELLVASRALEDALDRFAASSLPAADGATPERADAMWEASIAALAATSPLANRLQRRVSRILLRLDRHWTSLNLLVLASLLLAGSNLALLQLTQRRRRELAASKAEIERRGSHDPLTGLWNRAAILRLLREELARAGRTGLPLGVLVADLDRFHEANVLLGQDQGDFILRELADRLGTMVRPYDTLGRFGGDIFLVVLPSCDAIATADVAERLRAAINERDVDHGLGKIRISVSLAHTTVGAGDDHDPDLLLHRLQESMKNARTEQGPGRIAVL